VPAENLVDALRRPLPAHRGVDALLGQLPRDERDRPALDEPPEYETDSIRGRPVDHELLVHDLVAEGRAPADPHALLLRGVDLVDDAGPDHLALEFRKGDENVEDHPPHWRRRVELLRRAHERDVVFLELLHEVGEVRQ